MAGFVARASGAGRGVPLGAFGMLAPLVAESGVTDVFVNGDGSVRVDRGAGAVAVEGMRLPAAAARELAVRLIGLGGRHVDEATPCVDVRLGDGVRVHAVLPPVSTGGALLSLRLPSPVRPALDDLEVGGFFERVPRAGILSLVERRANLLVTGAGGSGNTTWHK